MNPSDVLQHETVSSKPSRYWLGVVGVVILGATGVTGWQFWQSQNAQGQAPQATANVAEISTVTALGRLEPAGEIINLTAPTSIQESRIEQLLVDEGDYVSANQVIAILDNRDRLQAAAQKAKEQVRIAEAKLAQVQAGAKTGELAAQRAEIARLEADRATSIDAQRAAITRLEAEVENARIEAGRYDSLYQTGAISASQRDTKQLIYTTTKGQLQEAKARLARIQDTSEQQIQQAKATLDKLAEVRPVDVSAASAEVRSAQAVVAEAQANLDQAYIRSPRPGQVLKIHTQPGEKIAAAGIATLGQTRQMVVIAEVYQSDITKIAIGQPVTLTSSALSTELTGTVDRIGLEIKQQQVVNEDPAMNIDAKVIEVRIRLNAESSQEVAGLTNLQVTTKIQVQ